MSHLRLWDYLIERMREDLEGRVGIRWPDHWEARSFRYGPAADTTGEVVTYLRQAAY